MKPNSMGMAEKLIMEQASDFHKTLPPLPPGWKYELEQSVKFNPQSKTWDVVYKAKPRQVYSNKEGNDE